MELDGARTLVAGATGVLGGEISCGLAARGAQLVLAGRDETRLAARADELGARSTESFDAADPAQLGGVVDRAADTLGGLDLMVVAVGVAGFGPAADTDLEDVRHLFTVNTLAPIALTRAALPHLADGGGTVAVVSAILADYPTGDMAAYSASKAAVSAWLTALRHERRGEGITVFDIRPPHMDTGLADRGLGAAPPKLPDPVDTGEVVGHVLDGLAADHRELSYDVQRGALHAR